VRLLLLTTSRSWSPRDISSPLWLYQSTTGRNSPSNWKRYYPKMMSNRIKFLNWTRIRLFIIFNTTYCSKDSNYWEILLRIFQTLNLWKIKRISKLTNKLVKLRVWRQMPWKLLENWMNNLLIGHLCKMTIRQSLFTKLRLKLLTKRQY
jgi:hypothetical protein